MECKDEAAVERQKLVDDGEVENEDDQTPNVPVPPPNAPKSVQTPNSPVLSNRVSVSFNWIDSKLRLKFQVQRVSMSSI